MKKLSLIGICLLAMAALTVSGCAGTQYLKQTPVNGGYTVIQGGRTGVFGTDNSFVYIAPPTSATVRVTPPVIVKPEKVLLERTYTKSSTSWGNCKDKTPNKNAKNIRRSEESETWTEEVLSEPKVPIQVAQPIPQPAFGFGTNSSAGNVLAPALAVGGGYAAGQAMRRPDKYNSNINQQGGGASVGNVQGGNATGGQGGNATGGVANSTSKVGDVISNSESASASSSASNAEAWQNQTQDQSLDNEVEVGIDID